jgi:GLPGLI family protein
MKKIFLFCLFSLFTIVTALYGQQRIVTFNMGRGISANTVALIKHKNIGKATMEFMYDYRYLRDTADVKSEIKDRMILQVGDGISKFFSYRNMQIDSLLSTASANEVIAHPDHYSGGETFFVIKNYPTGKFTNIDKIATDWYLYEEDIPAQKWKLIEGTKTILGYTCQRAECDFRGRHYIAWYAVDIPVTNGPWKFGQLPGMIMEISDSKDQYSYTMVGIIPKAPGDIIIPDVKYYKTSRDKFYKTKHKFDVDPIGYLSSVSNINLTIRNDDGSINKKVMEVHKLKYDYIERDWK